MKRKGIWRWAWVCVLLLAGLVGAAQPAVAQGYRFRVDKNLSYVYVNADGSADVEYWLTFTNLSSWKAIDIVDVGLPHEHYRLDTAQADLDGTPLRDLRKSEVVEHGIEVHLGKYALKKDQTGTLHVRITVDRMVWEDTTNRDYASLKFSPTWFDSQFTEGATQLACTIIFPPGVTGDETRWHRQEYTQAQTLPDGRIAFTWANPKASPSSQYTFGVSFPRRYVDVVYHQPTWWEQVLGHPITWVITAIVLAFAGWWGWRFWRHRRKWRMEYLPPTVGVETAGPKRGLTAVEAAIVLNTPMDRVLTMILFGLVKKGAIKQIVSRDPLRLKMADLAKDREQLYPYERDFMRAVGDDGRLDRDQLQEAMVKLVKRVNTKLRGFNHGVTRAYYRDIVARAWQQVRAAETPEVRAQALDEHLEWALLDPDFATTLPTVVGPEPLPLPRWWGHYVPASEPGAGPALELPPVSAPKVSLPDASMPEVSWPTLPGVDFANTLVIGVESTANHVVSGLEGFVRGVVQKTNPWAFPEAPPSAGEMAFGTLDRVGVATDDLFGLLAKVAENLPESSGGGGDDSDGGGSSSCACACACACAGCACACAGGGR